MGPEDQGERTEGYPCLQCVGGSMEPWQDSWTCDLCGWTPEHKESQPKLIYKYTRAQAIADGEYIDATAYVKEFFLLPCAFTRLAWGTLQAGYPSGFTVAETVECCVRSMVLEMMLGKVIEKGKLDFIHYDKYVAHFVSGDNDEPVCTIALPDES